MEKLKGFNSRVVSFLDRLIVISGYLPAYCVLCMMFLISYMVFTRRVLGAPLLNGDEYSIYLFIGSVSLGLGYTLREEGHISVTALEERLPQRIRGLLAAVNDIITFFFLVVSTWMSWDMVLDSYHTGKTTASALITPLYLPQAVIAIGFTLLFLASTLQIYLKLFKARKKR